MCQCDICFNGKICIDTCTVVTITGVSFLPKTPFSYFRYHTLCEVKFNLLSIYRRYLVASGAGSSHSSKMTLRVLETKITTGRAIA